MKKGLFLLPCLVLLCCSCATGASSSTQDSKQSSFVSSVVSSLESSSESSEPSSISSLSSVLSSSSLIEPSLSSLFSISEKPSSSESPSSSIISSQSLSSSAISSYVSSSSSISSPASSSLCSSSSLSKSSFVSSSSFISSSKSSSSFVSSSSHVLSSSKISSSSSSSSSKISSSSSSSSSSISSSSSSKTSSSSSSIADEYYKNFDFSLEGNKMLGQTHDLICSTHTTYKSYDDSKNPSYVVKLDPGLKDSSKVCEFYSQADWSSTWGGGKAGTWNREHVWPQSLSNGLWGSTGGGADFLHIRPCESRLNSSRNNNRYGVVSSRDSHKKYAVDTNNNSFLGGYLANSTFEPIDSVKGDVARIIMYVYIHYNNYSNVYGTTNGSGKSAFFGTLNFTKVINASNEANCIALLKSWHESDPVSELEIKRNNYAQSMQGNRNPLVDHPELVEAIW